MKRIRGGAIARQQPIAPTGKAGGMAAVKRTLNGHYEPGSVPTLDASTHYRRGLIRD